MSADSWRLASARQQEAGRSEENPADTRLQDTPSKQILFTYFQSTMPTAENSSGLGFGVGAPRERQMHSANGTKLMWQCCLHPTDIGSCGLHEPLKMGDSMFGSKSGFHGTLDHGSSAGGFGWGRLSLWHCTWPASPLCAGCLVCVATWVCQFCARGTVFLRDHFSFLRCRVTGALSFTFWHRNNTHT